ncbi:hypothetical protein K449DRAFT_427244 [Hypoxylon sp. EC38]|nr:hypothetical protein K449DRAFT_427244 [Hypoxylon sp. EC38]
MLLTQSFTHIPYDEALAIKPVVCRSTKGDPFHCSTMRNGKSEGKYASMRTSWALMQQPGKRKTNAPDPLRISCQNARRHPGDAKRITIHLSTVLQWDSQRRQWVAYSNWGFSKAGTIVEVTTRIAPGESTNLRKRPNLLLMISFGSFFFLNSESYFAFKRISGAGPIPRELWKNRPITRLRPVPPRISDSQSQTELVYADVCIRYGRRDAGEKDANAPPACLAIYYFLIIHVIGPTRCNPHAAMPNKDSATFLLGMMDLGRKDRGCTCKLRSGDCGDRDMGDAIILQGLKPGLPQSIRYLVATVFDEDGGTVHATTVTESFAGISLHKRRFPAQMDAGLKATTQ